MPAPVAPLPYPPGPLPYVRAFDGVRAGAVLLVVLMHWPLTRLMLPFGWVGVNLFFVLSGLLITRILVAARGPNGHRPRLATYLKRFYWRRTLRIFPLYYGYLLVAALGLGVGSLALLRAGSADWGLLLTYLHNWRDLAHGLRQPDTYLPYHWLFGHLWSLAVEEQYYLLFPLVVWLVPARWLRPLLLATVVGGALGRVALGEWLRAQPALDLGRSSAFLVMITPSQIDALALGGLLALGTGRGLRHPGRWLLLAGALALCWNLAHWGALRHLGDMELPPARSLGFDHPLKQFRYAPPAWAWLRMRWAFTFSWVNGLSALLLLWVQAGGARALLTSRPAVYVGRISYGVYVWHFAPVALLSLPAVRTWGAASATHELVLMGSYLALVLGVASASYYGFERHFLRLKERAFAPAGQEKQGAEKKP